MSVYFLYIFNELFKTCLSIFVLCVTFEILYPGRIKAQYYIRKICIPLYNKLESKYNAQYPTIMKNPNSELLNFSKLDDLDFIFFVQNSSFVIMKILDESIVARIPFDSVIYAMAKTITFSKRNYNSYIVIHFFSDQQAKCTISFDILQYFRNLNKKYTDRLDSEELIKFINTTFISKEDYEKSQH